MDPLLALVIIVALICVTVVTVVLTKSKGGVVLSIRLGRRNAPAEPAAWPRPSENPPSQIQPNDAQPNAIQPPAPALQDISFKQALESDALATGLEELSKRQVEYALGLNSPGSEAAIVESVVLAGEQDQLVIAYERRGTATPEKQEMVVSLDRQSGKFLPMLKDSGTGAFAKFTRRAPQAQRADAAALLTGVAHVTSGMNVLHGLKEIDRRLSALAETRSIDQLAEIETIYNRIAEIFSRSGWQHRRADLVASRDQLFKLRATWRRELEQVLDSAPETPDTQAAEGFAKTSGIFFPPAFFLGKTLEAQREAEEEKLFGHLANVADLLQRIRLSMLLDISVSQALGEAETLAGVAMRNELEMWDGIVEKFKSKRKGIRTFETPADLQTVQEGLQGYVAMLSSVSTMKIQRSPAKPGGNEPPVQDAYAQHASSENGAKQLIDSRNVLAGDTAESGKLLASNSDDPSPEKRLLNEGAIPAKLLGTGTRSGEA